MQHVTQTDTKIHTPKAVPKVNSVELQHKKKRPYIIGEDAWTFEINS